MVIFTFDFGEQYFHHGDTTFYNFLFYKIDSYILYIVVRK